MSKYYKSWDILFHSQRTLPTFREDCVSLVKLIVLGTLFVSLLVGVLHLCKG